MPSHIIQTDNYAARITVSRIAALPTHFHLRVESQNTDAKDPEAWRTVFDTTLQQWGLEAIGKEIFDAVVDETNSV